MTTQGIHNIVGCVISADPWPPFKMVLVRRRTKEEGEEYWPGRWCYLTEHKNPGESDKDTIARLHYEELGLPPPKFIIKGPVDVESIDPDHHEKFKIKLYQCMPTDLKNRMLIDPALNLTEASRWIWASQPFYNDAAIIHSGGKLFEDLNAHLTTLYKVMQDIRRF